jgi:hypothetical protein
MRWLNLANSRADSKEFCDATNVFVGDRAEERVVDVRLPAKQVCFQPPAVDIEHRRRCVRYLDDGGNAPRICCRGPRLNTLFLGVARFAKVDVAVDQTGEDYLAVK